MVADAAKRCVEAIWCGSHPPWLGGPIVADMEFRFSTGDARRHGRAYTGKAEAGDLAPLVLDGMRAAGLSAEAGDVALLWAPYDRHGVTVFFRPARVRTSKATPTDTPKAPQAKPLRFPPLDAVVPTLGAQERVLLDALRGSRGPVSVETLRQRVYGDAPRQPRNPKAAISTLVSLVRGRVFQAGLADAVEIKAVYGKGYVLVTP